MKKQFFVVSLALILMLSFAMGVSADETKTNDVDITVNAGDFSLETSSIDSFGDITLQATPQTYKTSFDNNFTVTDLRGSQDGWRLDVSASPFESVSDKIPTGSLSLEAIDSIDRVGTGSSTAPSKSTSTNTIIDDGTVEIAKADIGTGMGVFDITFPDDALSLVVDATTAKVGTYESTLTWNLVTAP